MTSLEGFNSKVADVYLYEDVVYIFSTMYVDRIGSQPMHLVAFAPRVAVEFSELGRLVREAIRDSLAWVEWSEYESTHASREPLADATGVPNRRLVHFQQSSGNARVVDELDFANYALYSYVWKRGRGTPLEIGGEPTAKGCIDEALGERLWLHLTRSLEANLDANKK